MRGGIVGVVLLGALALAPGLAHAAYLSCQAELRNPDCSERTGSLKAGEQLLIGATCQECTGGGSDVKCSPDEKVSVAGLAIESAAGAAVAGTFSVAGSCAFGVSLFKHSAALGTGSYRVVVSVAGFAKTELLAFTVGGGAPAGDGGGKPAPREAGSVSRDGGTSPLADSGVAAGDGTTARGDGAGTPGAGSSDGGCGCELVGTAPPPLALVLALGVLALRSRRRSR
jgi:MYXO-CTERM domain-containing protein